MNGERDIRELLQAKASEMPPSAGIPGVILQRSKRRRGLTALAVSLAVVIVGAGALAGVKAMSDRPSFDPVRPGPTRTERDSSRLRDSAVEKESMAVNLDMDMTEVSRGDRPDGSSWFLRVGHSGDTYCAELLPDRARGCWSRQMTTDRFSVDVILQGASSDARHQYVLGVVDSDVTRVIYQSKGGYSAQAMTSPGPSELETNARFFAVFAPKKSAGLLTGYDRAGDEAGRLRLARVMGTGAAACEGGPKSQGSSAESQMWPLPNLGPIEMFAMSFGTLIASGSECATAVEYSPPRRAGRTNR
jgi:hypothetical protein